MEPIPYIDPFLRYATLSLLLLLGLFTIRDGWHNRTVRFAAFLTFSSAAVIISTSVQFIDIPRPLFIIARFLDVPAMPLIWLFGMSLFQDEYRPSKPFWCIIFLNIFITIIFRFNSIGLIEFTPLLYSICNYLSDWSSIGLMVHLAMTTIYNRTEDLVEARRQFRMPFTLSLAFVGVFMILGEEILEGEFSYTLNISRILFIFFLGLWGFLQLTKLDPNRLTFGAAPTPIKGTKPLEAAAKNRENKLTSDPDLLITLTKAMEEDKLYRQQGLTITALASHVNRPEHQLRHFINRELGARNFTQFLNGYRLNEAVERLTRAEDVRTSVLTIAMDVGFNSLAPFNRAFKDRFQMTPTDYRRKSAPIPDRF